MSELLAALPAQVSQAFAAELSSRTSWGEPPCLYTIRMREGRCRLDPATVPPAWWSDGPLWEVLARVARTAGIVTGIRRARPHADAYGIAVRFEGHSAADAPLDPPLDPALDPEQFRHADTDAVAREARNLTAVRVLVGADRAGLTYQARLLRGESAVRNVIALPANELARSGEITAAVHRLTAIATGIPQPGQEPWAEPGK